jgi:hypothetical protein
MGFLSVFPPDRLGGTKGSFVNLPVGRSGGDAAKKDAFQAKSICRPEHRSNVIQTPDIIQDHPNRDLFHLFVLINRQAVKFFIQQLSHVTGFPAKLLFHFDF